MEGFNDDYNQIDRNTIKSDVNTLYQRVSGRFNELKGKIALGNATDDEKGAMEQALNNADNSLHQLAAELNGDNPNFQRIKADYDKILKDLTEKGLYFGI